MSTDPIKLIPGITPSKSTSSTAGTTATRTASTATSNDAYKLAASLQDLLANGPSGSTSLSGNYTAKGLQEAFQSPQDIQAKQEAASATSATSAQAQEIVNAKKATSTDVGLDQVDEKLAQTVGIARVIGSM
jgi:hypothetical protein